MASSGGATPDHLTVGRVSWRRFAAIGLPAAVTAILVVLTAQRVLTFTLLSGSSACPKKGNFSATFGPVKDTSVKSHPHVFVN